MTEFGYKCQKLPNSCPLELIACTRIRCSRLRLRFLSHGNTAISVTANKSILLQGCLGTAWCADQTQSVGTMRIQNDSSQMLLYELNRFHSLGVNSA